jgi:hypothetical protein
MRLRRESGGGVAHLPAAHASARVELGYATTAHRAQGRTVDTAHAFVTPSTMREPLYVMAARGRESNMLYVDTAYDPHASSSHEAPVQTDPPTVLEQVLARSGADLSATETRAREAANIVNPARLQAEAAAVIALQRAGQASYSETGHRHPGVLVACCSGVPPICRLSVSRLRVIDSSALRWSDDRDLRYGPRDWMA